MFHKAKSVTAVLLFISPFSANADEPNRLPLPQDSEPYRYQLLTDMSFYIEDDDDATTLRERMLVDYHVTDAEDRYTLEVTPHYMTSNRSEGQSWNSLWALSHQYKISDGMALSLDKDHMLQRLMFRYDVEQADKLEEEPRNLLDVPSQLHFQLARPGLAAGIKLEKGEELELSSQELLPTLTVSVIELEEEAAVLQVQSNDDDTLLFGYITVDRESGWPLKSHFIVDMAYRDEDDVPRTMHAVIALKPADWPLGLRNNKFARFTPQERRQFQPFHEYQLPVEEDVFPTEYGAIHPYSNRFELNYHHQVADVQSMGRLELSDLQALAHHGEPLDMPLNALEPTHSQTGIGGTDAASMFKVWPLGWHYDSNSISNVESIEATLSWYPMENHSFTLPLSDETVTWEQSGSRAVLTSDTRQGSYRLHLDAAEGARFRVDLDDVVSMVHEYPVDETAPGWLSEGEKRFLNANKHHDLPSSMVLNFEEGIDEVRLELLEEATQPSAQRRIPFYSHKGRQNSLIIPPEENVPLYRQPELAYNETREFESSPLQELAPETFGRPQLYMTLTREQDALCELIAPDTQINGSDLAWYRVTANTGPRSEYSLLLSPNVNYLLVNHEHTQSAFYQEEVEFGLQCEGDPEWRKVALEPGEHDWLIDLKELLGENWRSLPMASQSLEAFLNHYRFMDESGQPMAVIRPSTEADPLIREDSLSEFATETGLLRIQGHVEHVEQLHSVGEPTSLQWTYQFPLLPGYRGDLYSAEGNRP